jgi:hypothetical protein
MNISPQSYRGFVLLEPLRPWTPRTQAQKRKKNEGWCSVLGLLDLLSKPVQLPHISGKSRSKNRLWICTYCCSFFIPSRHILCMWQKFTLRGCASELTWRTYTTEIQHTSIKCGFRVNSLSRFYTKSPSRSWMVLCSVRGWTWTGTEGVRVVVHGFWLALQLGTHRQNGGRRGKEKKERRSS